MIELTQQEVQIMADAIGKLPTVDGYHAFKALDIAIQRAKQKEQEKPNNEKAK